MGVWEWKAAAVFTLICAVCMPAGAKDTGVFFPPELLARARANIAKYPWAAGQKKNIIEAARPWMKLSDDELWGLMFGPTIHRSWMVLSDGYCPACKKPVPMYTWEVDALAHPWKVRCPHCKQYFPKNDFKAFYKSGLDEHGIFDPKKADRSLLFNAEHPDVKDPLHAFGVDDGEGYVEGDAERSSVPIRRDKRWRFISAYLIYGQWKQAVLNGIRNLAAAYVVTGDPKYAHKAGILLDRVADLYPTFDFSTQAYCYEVMLPSNHGYVSVWHDACEETRELAMAYDMVRDAIPGDKKLLEFLSGKAGGSKDIERNIEDRILRDALNNIPKISSNYPRTEIAKIVMMSVLDRPRDEIDAVWDAMLTRATAVDGVTGEKGLAGYTAFTIQSVASLIEQFSRLDPEFLRDLLKRHPRIHDMYRFHVDTWCMQEYYPQVGDAGGFVRKCAGYVGVIFTKDPGGSMWTFAVTPSMFSFIWRLYEVTGDTAFVQVLYGANGDSVEDLPFDLFCDDPAAFQKAVKGVIARVGPTIEVPSVNKQDWHIAILRSGKGSNARAAWLEYDAWGGHGHANCMHLGLFAKGLDLLPDFGYKPVQFGGWSSPQANWYGMTAAHNTVVVDGREQGNGAGKTILWADGEEFHAIRASGPTASGVKEFERTVAMVDTSEKDSYILDVFRVVGGKDHAKFTGSHFGTITTQGLTLKPAPDYGYGTQMRNFQVDAKP
ncbi:MAG TPA: heparinase II/III family protein, partial [Armatimonadota bacterium]|nr:heparinase II/III family protein [Armatimonadota bacterium]